MIIAYKVSYFDEVKKEQYVFPVPLLFRKQAEAHVRYLAKAGATRPEINAVEIEQIAGQKIVVAGDVAHYQFSATTMGKRTVSRKVYNIENSESEGLVGLAYWKGRTLKVVLRDYISNWRAVERIV